MNRHLFSIVLALLVGLGFGIQPVWAEKDHGDSKRHDGGYSKGHGSKGGMHGRGKGYGMGRHHGGAGHLIRGLLRGAKEMALTEDQISKLKTIQLDLDRTRIKTEADIKIAEREVAALNDDDKGDLAAIQAKLKESAAMQVSLRMTAIKTRRAAMAVLTPEQSKRVKMFHERMKQQRRSGRRGHDEGRGMMKGDKQGRHSPQE